MRKLGTASRIINELVRNKRNQAAVGSSAGRITELDLAREVINVTFSYVKPTITQSATNRAQRIAFLAFVLKGIAGCQKSQENINHIQGEKKDFNGQSDGGWL